MPLFRLEKSEGDDMSKGKLVIAPKTKLELEKHLENWLENSPEQTLAQEDFLWIGRQTSAKDEDGTIYSDLLGVDSGGNLVVAELKKGRTPRDIVAQLLDYAAWADGLSEEEVRKIAESYFETRDELQEKSFDDAFKNMFDMLETDEIPPLNRALRLFIVAEEIPERVARVCRFLRTSHGINISCVDVSIFQTESGEVVVSTETIVGDEDFAAPKTQQQERPSSPPRPPSDHPVDQATWEAVQEFTKEDPNVKFTLRDIEQILSEKYPDLAESSSPRNRIRGSCVNFHSRESYPKGENRYWRVEKGVYRLYDPERDKV
jgi:hypothetical protein